MRLFVFLSILPIFVLAESELTISYDKEASWVHGGKVYLVTTPKSGTHWLGYSLTTLSGHAILYAGGIQNRTGAVHNQNLPPIIQKHVLEINSIEDHSEDKLILLTRNHLDSLMRLFENYETVIKVLKNQVQAKRMYPEDFHYPLLYNKALEKKCGENIGMWCFLYEQLYIYDKWNDDKKILIHYEDLISNPNNVFAKIMTFLEEDWPVSEYVNELQFHKKNLLSHYNKFPFGKCNSDGNTLNAYRKDLSPDQVDEINSLLEEIDPNLYKKYIQD